MTKDARGIISRLSFVISKFKEPPWLVSLSPIVGYIHETSYPSFYLETGEGERSPVEFFSEWGTNACDEQIKYGAGQLKFK